MNKRGRVIPGPEAFLDQMQKCVVQFWSTYGMERPEFRVFPIVGKRRWNNGL